MPWTTWTKFHMARNGRMSSSLFFLNRWAYSNEGLRFHFKISPALLFLRLKRLGRPLFYLLRFLSRGRGDSARLIEPGPSKSRRNFLSQSKNIGAVRLQSRGEASSLVDVKVSESSGKLCCPIHHMRTGWSGWSVNIPIPF